MIRPDISGTTALCLIIGDPIAHTLTPAMHNAAYSASNLNYCMAAATVRQEDLSQAIAGIRALSIRGLAVTMPHKASICSMLDELDPIAKAIGAVNTVTNNNGLLTGYNTDWLGVGLPLKKRVSLAGKRVAVLGAGGAAQAAMYACTELQARVTIFNRTGSKAAILARNYSANWEELVPTSDLRSYDIIINTTSVGMGELQGQSPIPLDQISAHQIIFETIYNPRNTPLVQHARSVGCRVITGDEMFLEQGAAQFELHTGQPAPRATMEQAVAPNSTQGSLLRE